MPFYFNDVCYYEGINLDRDGFLQKLENNENFYIGSTVAGRC